MRSMSYNLAEFKEFIRTRNIVCFGAGLQGLHIIYILENWGMSDKILAFMDNNPDKWHTDYRVEDYSYPIIPVSDGIDKLEEDTLLLITCADVVGVKEQLAKYPALDDIKCCSLAELAQQQLLASDYPAIVREVEEPLIPKKIHYCWFGDAMPAGLKDNVARWRDVCPDYEIILWNEQNYDIKSNKYMYDAYQAQAWGFVPDYMRLDIIYKYGGIYMDTDVALLRKPDELLHQQGFLITDGSFFVNPGAGFGAKPKHPFIAELRDYYDDVPFLANAELPDMTACQIHHYRVMRKYGLKVKDELQNINGLNVYPMIMASTNTYSMQRRISDKAYFCHYGTSFWMGEEHHIHKKRLREVDIDGLIGYSL